MPIPLAPYPLPPAPYTPPANDFGCDKDVFVLAEAGIDKRHRRIVKWVLHKEITVKDLVAADLNHNGFITAFHVVEAKRQLKNGGYKQKGGCLLQFAFCFSLWLWRGRLCVWRRFIMPIPLAPYPLPPAPYTPPENGSESQLVCSGCRNLLLSLLGATSVCCAVYNAVTDVPPPGTENAQLVCGGCHTLLMYIRGATSVKCSCCHTVNLAMEANQVAQVNCGNCQMLLMYQYGAVC